MWTVIRKLLDRKPLMFIVMFILALTGILGRIVYTFYRDYEKTIIVQVEQHLLTIAEEISTSIELFIKEKADSLKVVGNNRQLADSIDKVNGISEKNFLKAYYDAQKDAIQRVYVINKAGKMVFQYPQPDEKLMPKINAMLQTDINRVIHNQRSMLGSAQKDEVGQFVLNIYEPIFEKWEFKGILVSSIRLDAIYKNLVQPVVPGKKGYTMVKDMEGTIIMHPTKNQIGIHVLETRKKRNPELDFTDLEKLIERQLKGEKGTAEYYSYWWQDKVLTKTKKLNGFAPAHIGDYFWVVAVLMSYEEIEGPIRQNLIRIVQITIIIVLMLSGTIFIILKIQRNQEALEVETKYLKELNHALE
jgi:two-component system cell cycle sensor histidine kinase/response regulator CckA